MIRVHRTSVGTYHPVPGDEVAWTVNDNRGYADNGVECSECNACECDVCEACGEPICCEGINDSGYCGHNGRPTGDNECIGLSFTYVCLDGGDTLCEACAEKEGLEVIECDCM